ncbi:MAG: hypothetical protein WAK48_29100 [Candidatus Acidiferrum sp.]
MSLKIENSLNFTQEEEEEKWLIGGISAGDASGYPGTDDRGDITWLLLTTQVALLQIVGGGQGWHPQNRKRSRVACDAKFSTALIGSAWSSFIIYARSRCSSWLQLSVAN